MDSESKPQVPDSADARAEMELNLNQRMNGLNHFARGSE